jgi:hypothetical protein
LLRRNIRAVRHDKIVAGPVHLGEAQILDHKGCLPLCTIVCASLSSNLAL